jgi:hypothetical protein
MALSKVFDLDIAELSSHKAAMDYWKNKTDEGLTGGAM